MFDELNKYKHNDHFFLRPTDNLDQVCNAPIDKRGVYVFYALKGGRIELVYIGCSLEARSPKSSYISNKSLGSLKDRLVNGIQFGEPRKESLTKQLIEENIEALDIYWFVTHSDKFVDSPTDIEHTLLQMHFNIHGRLPRWNNEF